MVAVSTTLPVNKLIYKAIYVLDNVFDDTPQRFGELSALCPQTIEQVKALGSTPCSLLQELGKDSTVIAELLTKYAEFVPAFNEMSYLMFKTQEVRKLCRLDDIKGTREHFLQLGARNFHVSLFARLIQDNANNIAKGNGHNATLKNLSANADILLAGDFVKINQTVLWPHPSFADELPPEDLRQLPSNMQLVPILQGKNTGRQLVCSHEHMLFAHDRLGAYQCDVNTSQLLHESSFFVEDELLDFFSDLNTEKKSHVPTPNLLVNYIRFSHPEIDLQKIQSDVERHWNSAKSRLARSVAREDNIKKYVFPLSDLKEIDPGLHSLLVNTATDHLESLESLLFLYPSEAVKASARQYRQQKKERE